MNIQEIVRLLIEHYGTEEKLASAIFVGDKPIGQSSVNRWANGVSLPRGRAMMALLDLARKIPRTAPLVGAQAPVDAEAFSPTIVPGRELVGHKDFPIFAAAMGGDGYQIVTFDAIDYVKRPTIVEHVKEAYGIYIVGESMVPAFESGDMALVNPRLPPARDKNVVLYHVPPVGGTEAEAIVKRLMGFNDRDWHLRQYNPKRDFDEARVDWPICHRIVGKYEAR